MTRINTNVSSLTAQNRLQRTNNDLQTALTRLSTGLRINSGKDDPAGLIASESLRSDITSINKALSNTQRANQIIGTADSALGQVSSLLNDIRGLVTEAANKGALSTDEIAANQLQIDSSLEAINRIAQTTTFQGRRLLDGSLDFQVQQGTNFSSVKDLQIDSANLGATGSVGVSVAITAAATKASVATDVDAAAVASKASTKITFGDTVATAQASATVSLSKSYALGTEATGDILLVNAKTALAQASGTLSLASGTSLKIAANQGSSVDGTVGNNVKINVTTGAIGSTTTGSYDAATNTLSLTVAKDKTGAEVVTALSAISGLTDKFTFSNGNAVKVADGDADIKTSVLTGGTDEVATTHSKVVEFGSGLYKATVTAVATGAFGGNKSLTTDFTYTYGATTGATFDTTANTVTITINKSDSAATVSTALTTALSGQFTFVDSSSGTFSGSSATGTVTDGLAGGTSTVLTTTSSAGFKLTAKDGGAADGAAGTGVDLKFTAAPSGTSTSAVYDAVNKKLTVSVGQGATINDITAAINAQGDFVASNTRFGNYRYDSTDTAIDQTDLSGGASPLSASSFKLNAKAGGVADGSIGTGATLKFASGTNTGASYDTTTKQLTVTVAEGATTNDIVSAINTNGVFEVSAASVVNGGARFDLTGGNADLTSTTTFAGGASATAPGSDELVISTTTAGSTAVVPVSFVEDASVTTDSPTATYTAGGTLTIKVNNAGNTSIAKIRDAINALSGTPFTASITPSPTSNGDGFYNAAIQTAPTVASLSGGSPAGGLKADLTFQLTGKSGSEVFKFQAGATISNIVQSVNLLKDSTGIEASINTTNNKLEFKSTDYGSSGLVGIEVISEGAGGTFSTGIGGNQRVSGTDVQATVNGTIAAGDGNKISLNTSTLNFSLTVADGTAASTIAFTINGGGAQFQLGPDVVSNQQARLGISSLNTAKIGGVSGKLFELASGGAKSLTTDVSGASKVVDEVISKVTTLRGRLGAFQRTALDSNIASLNDTLTNLNEAQSSIRDADFAKESANLTRAQILVQSGTSVLGIANQSTQSVLSLLR